MIDPRDLVTGLLAVIGTYFWYDKAMTDKRVDQLGTEISKLKYQAAEQSKKHDVLETKIDGLREVIDLKFTMVLKALSEIEKRKT